MIIIMIIIIMITIIITTYEISLHPTGCGRSLVTPALPHVLGVSYR